MNSMRSTIGNRTSAGFRRGRGERIARPARAAITLWAMLVLCASLGAAPAGGSLENLPPGSTITPLAEVFFIQRHPVTRHIEWLGSSIVWVLMALSVVSLGLMGARAWESRAVAELPPTLEHEIRRALGARQVDQALQAAGADRSILGAVFRAALSHAAHGHAAMIRAAQAAADEAALQRMRRIEPLNVIGTVAPMIGLFGTVYGIILAFREIVASGGTPDPVSLAAGIGTALTTTFWGLVVAIPALAGYGMLRTTIDGRAARAWQLAEDLLDQFRPEPAPPAARV